MFHPKSVIITSTPGQKDYVIFTEALPDGNNLEFFTAPQQGLKEVRARLGEKAFKKVYIIMEVKDCVD